jgi:hypothetical protein
MCCVNKKKEMAIMIKKFWILQKILQKEKEVCVCVSEMSNNSLR